MTLVVDASVAIKWVLHEDGAQAARDLLNRSDLAAPDFIILECASTLSRHVRRGTIASADAAIALGKVRNARVRLSPAMALLDEAQALALQLNAATYDCLYLALAINEGATLVTADVRFLNAAASRSAYAPHVRQL